MDKPRKNTVDSPRTVDLILARKDTKGLPKAALQCGTTMRRKQLRKGWWLIGMCMSAAWLTTHASSSIAGEDGSRPNVIFIMADDMGKASVGCFRGDLSEETLNPPPKPNEKNKPGKKAKKPKRADPVNTPVLDGLAKTGMRLTNFYSMPQCTPSRAALLTAQYPYRNGWVNHFDVPRWNLKGFNPKTNPCIGNVMKSAGYKTCIVGKWQISDFREEPKILNECGFDEFCVWTGYEHGNPPSDMRYWNPYLHTAAGSRTYEGRYGPAICNDFLLDFVRENKDEPMFIYYPMILKHGGAGSDDYEGMGMVACIDHFVGRLVEVLDETGIRDNTILIWTTDNGPRKGSTSESGCCEPFIVNCPGTVPEGVVSAALVDITDILPTFAELGGAKLPTEHTLDGISFAKLITGKAKDSDRQWILAMGGGACAKVEGTGNANGSLDGANKTSFRDRVLRDKAFKLYLGKDRQVEKFIRMNANGSEGEPVDPKSDARAEAAYKKFMKVVETFPEKDANPTY
jgi:arylsulfatase A-like enzyme